MDGARPRPLRVALAVLGAVQTISMATLPVLNGLGVTSFNSETLGLLTVLIGAIVASVGSVFTAIYMEARVTPISDPMTMAFTPLTPITEAELQAQLGI